MIKSIVNIAAAAAAIATTPAISSSHPNSIYLNNSFDRISLRGPDRLIVRFGSEFSLEATGDPADLRQLKIDVVGGQLLVDRQGKRSKQSRSVSLYVTLPHLLAADVAGSGSIDIQKIQSDKLTLAIGGSGAISATGSTGVLKLSLDGSGAMNTKYLLSSFLDVSFTGSGIINATTRGKAKVYFSGSGVVDISGTSDCLVSGNGSGNFRCG